MYKFYIFFYEGFTDFQMKTFVNNERSQQRLFNQSFLRHSKLPFGENDVAVVRHGIYRFCC